MQSEAVVEGAVEGEVLPPESVEAAVIPTEGAVVLEAADSLASSKPQGKGLTRFSREKNAGAEQAARVRWIKMTNNSCFICVPMCLYSSIFLCRSQSLF